MRFHFNLISRINNSTQFLISNISLNPDFDFTLQSRLNWSKNVREEREAPNQILIGDMNPLYCVLLEIAVYMKVFLGIGRGGLNLYLFAFNNSNAVPAGREQSKQIVQNVLRTEILNRPEFSGPEIKVLLAVTV